MEGYCSISDERGGAKKIYTCLGNPWQKRVCGGLSPIKDYGKILSCKNISVLALSFIGLGARGNQ